MMKSELIKRVEDVIKRQMDFKEEVKDFKEELENFKAELEDETNAIRIADLVSSSIERTDKVIKLEKESRKVARDSYAEMAELINLTLTDNDVKDEYETIEDFFVGIQRRVDESVYEIKELEDLINEIGDMEV